MIEKFLKNEWWKNKIIWKKVNLFDVETQLTSRKQSYQLQMINSESWWKNELFFMMIKHIYWNISWWKINSFFVMKNLNTIFHHKDYEFFHIDVENIMKYLFIIRKNSNHLTTKLTSIKEKTQLDWLKSSSHFTEKVKSFDKKNNCK